MMAGRARRWLNGLLAVLALLLGLVTFQAWLAPDNVAAWLSLAAFCN